MCAKRQFIRPKNTVVRQNKQQWRACAAIAHGGGSGGSLCGVTDSLGQAGPHIPVGQGVACREQLCPFGAIQAFGPAVLVVKWSMFVPMCFGTTPLAKLRP